MLTSASCAPDSGDELYSPGIWTDEVLSEFDQLARDALRGSVALTGREPIEITIRAGAPLDGADLDDAAPGVANLARGELPLPEDIASDCALQDALLAALAGDGAPLAVLSRSCPLSWNDVQLIEVVLPRIRAHRGELALALRMLRDPRAYEETSPFVLIETYAQYRDLSRLAGDKEEAAHWQQLVDRFAELLSDRRRAQAFAIATR